MTTGERTPSSSRGRMPTGEEEGSREIRVFAALSMASLAMYLWWSEAVRVFGSRAMELTVKLFRLLG